MFDFSKTAKACCLRTGFGFRRASYNKASDETKSICPASHKDMMPNTDSLQARYGFDSCYQAVDECCKCPDKPS